MDKKKNYAVFISSSDSYADIWDMFFHFFKKLWPDFDGSLLLNTTNLSYKFENKEISTQVKDGKFGKVFNRGLDMIKEDYVLLIMIDYLFMDKVNAHRLQEYYKSFLENDLDVFYLIQRNLKDNHETDIPGFRIVNQPMPDEQLFGFQMAFWKKNVLKEMVLGHEDPWFAEYFGSKRAKKMKIKVGFVEKEYMPILYDANGCLHQGLWMENAVKFLKEQSYDKIDFEKRGYYNDNKVYQTKKFWRIFTIKKILTGLRGSYWDLIARTPIH